ncbi:HAMP domain-containing sensor histidine kinase [Streptomyces sp. NBC_01767]|uniref:sensor histidine kinase n=1 Tax=Streptomyces sp. NBC_01767 TaxID=2975937 RepID=UPI00224FEC5D|nr:HAMP domain-containing sensor histidine kinase [Streptomyces sp. NBC_01767]MCX4399541.1 HAMP domain-containing histidine kinase [Streptomyces sp. NBC_01767]
MSQAGAGRRPSLQRLPLRGRLTLMTTTVFAVLGGGLLLLNWLSTRQLLKDNRHRIDPASMLAPAQTAPSPTTPQSPSIPASLTTPAQRFEDFQHTILSDLLLRSLLLLAVFTALAGLLAWWGSSRSLHRLSQVTAAARRISTGSTLDERLGLTGPHDEVRELGDTFDTMLDRLDRSFTAQRRFTAHASHELRTPLTLQRTALEIPLAQGRVPADLRPAFQRALDATARSERLIAALLTLAHGESAQLTPQPVDLKDAARDALADLADEARTAGIRITADPVPAPVAGDPSLLRQIALNLLANAVRHNHHDGTATVTTGTLGGLAFIEVGNTGPVLDPDEIPALFEPFQRGREHRSDGTGLGLAVVRAITLTHHGELTATPRPDGGLTVRVELPTTQMEQVPQSPASEWAVREYMSRSGVA